MELRILCILTLFGLAGCHDATTLEKTAPPQVGVVTLKAQPFTYSSDLTGRTTATLTSSVLPQVGGIIQRRLFKEGDEVKAGQALYQIDPSSYQAAYDQAAAALQSAKALVIADCQKAKRYAILVKEQGVSKQDADDAAATCGEDKASVAEKAAALEADKINLNWTRVTAPISGHIGISTVTPGALVTANQTTALTTITALDSMYVDLTRSSVDLLQLRKRALATNSDTLDVTLTLEDGSVYPEKGKLELTEVSVDESTGSVTLRAIFPNPQHVLLPGMFVHASVDEGVIENAVLAPQQSIIRDPKGNATAFVVDASNKVVLRNVVTATNAGDNYLITHGLQAGDRVIVEGTGKVNAGDTVKPVEVQVSAAAATPAAKPAATEGAA
ncbi:membrane fusion protein (multidrug efflux system) [Gibbsiella quercinecans]|uniref:Efflux transporter periplasmic adaptor subunit n=1 Tax=Gibbsiella quercinecans TaxID=929813 RepID=A0A250AWM5_9GAMM|nr:efflux RND transporter periplasmic adaptor subunit [Gibbsiella quercinecans]ATA18255.1 efflux transporter periplasmic adaptor subunit [Gibbsiella quercinecans]RLM12980.1 efflux transporter periplasmic adaptor subunit [Gibbsiella quercinecans]RLM14534.1 efflux transporter periplasmic adaptor subunit [Gibbsiella quercinecans]TCT90831.1 membrane fusion protein (multidrug efflux system) [Gibbsiella quercinecans]